MDDGVAVFHRKDTKSTLKHLAFRRPSGLTPAEAHDLLGRRCYRPLQLAEQQEIHAVDWQNTTLYLHSWPSRRDDQLSQHQTDQPTDVTPEEPAKTATSTETNFSLPSSQSLSHRFSRSLPNEQLHFVLRQFEGDSFDALERRIRRNHSFRDALGYVEPEDVPDGTSLWRAFDDLNRTNSVTASSRCVASCSMTTITLESS